MKKVWTIVAVAVVCALAGHIDARAEGGDLSYLTAQKRPISVFLKDVTNGSGQEAVSADAFRKAIGSALLNRKSVAFTIAEKPESSDVQVSAVITKYQYMEKDPVKFSPSAGSLILDAATTENYVEMASDFTVVDTKSGREAWKGSVETYIKRMMTPEESVSLIYEKLARNFLAKSFGKGK